MTLYSAPYFWFVFYRDTLLLRSGAVGAEAVPRALTPPLPAAREPHPLGFYRGTPCYAYSVGDPPTGADWSPTGLRAAFDVLGDELYHLAGKGRQLLYWEEHARFCPACGVKTLAATPLSKRCPGCGHELFPPIAAAVLVLVLKEDAVLLVRGRNFKGPNHGLVAGFLEPGETLEECAKREVREETSLAVDSVRYFGCQPWPYPSGLMVGFTAQYSAGQIVLQQEELSAAAFFTRDKLPLLPNPLSLARRMIDWWIEQGAR